MLANQPTQASPAAETPEKLAITGVPAETDLGPLGAIGVPDTTRGTRFAYELEAEAPAIRSGTLASATLLNERDRPWIGPEDRQAPMPLLSMVPTDATELLEASRSDLYEIDPRGSGHFEHAHLTARFASIPTTGGAAVLLLACVSLGKRGCRTGDRRAS